MRARLAALSLVALLAGCIVDDAAPPDDGDGPTDPPPAGSAWRASACALAQADAASAPDLLVVRVLEDGVARLERFGMVDGEYRRAAVSDVVLAPPDWPAAGFGVAALGDAVFVHGTRPGDASPGIVRLDGETLQSGSRVDVQRFGSMTAEAGVLWVATDEFLAYDEDLQRLGRVDLPIKTAGAGKVVHDVLVHDGVAFLLDDVVMPLFIFRVDVTDPGSMSVIGRGDLSGGHLPGHWLDVEESRWIVLLTWGGRGGGYLDAMSYPFDGGEPERLRLHESSWNSTDPSDRSESGYSILAHSGRSPVWAFVSNATGVAFGRVDVDASDERATFCEARVPFPLDVGERRPPSGVHAAAGRVVAHWGDRIVVLQDDSRSPALLASASLGAGVADVRLAT